MESAVAGISADRRSLVSLIARLRSPSGQANPFPLYHELRERGDVVRAPWGAHLLTGYEVCEQVHRNGRTWLVPDAAWRARNGAGSFRWNAPSVQGLVKTLAWLNAPEHTRQRRSLGNVFGRGAIDALRPFVEATVERLLDTLAERLREEGEADFVPLVSEELPVATLGHWMGIPAGDHALLRELMHALEPAQELLPTKSELESAAVGMTGLRDYFTAFVRDRRRHPGDDPVSRWMRTWDEIEPDREAADENLYNLAMFLTIASLETSSTTLSVMVSLLARDRDRWQWLRAHPAHVPDAVEEVLRYDPAIHVSTRVAAEPTVIGGVPVEKDEMVHVLLGSANHDPRRYPDPDTFDIHRKASHLSFGVGPHYCLGAALGRLQTTSLLTGLLRRFPRLGVGAEPVFAPRVAFRRLMELKVVHE
ncbi:cytochrome P450 [Streptomyces albus subsp. chlorinus]|uniref:cytochrome P450 n=1 Tax=Streptomyces albus TaxID=1888 RepID=UPI0031F68DE5